jgi:hypothetical protein
MSDQVRSFDQVQKLKASVAAAHAEARTAFFMKICSSTRAAMTAFTVLRSQANSSTAAVVGEVFSSVILSAQQAADLRWKALLDGPVPRAVVDRSIRYMHAFNTCQQTFQATAHTRVCEQQAVAQQLCRVHVHRSLRASAAVNNCWGLVLQNSRRMAAAHNCNMSSQQLVQINAACTGAFRNALAAVVANHAADAVQRHNSETAALPRMVTCAQDADVMARSATDSERQFQSGSEHAQRAEHIGSRIKSGYSAKQHKKQEASTSKSSNSVQLASIPKATEVRLKTQPLSTQRPRSASGEVQRPGVPMTTSTRHKDTPHRRLTSAAANYSRSAQLLTSQHMPSHQAPYMQGIQELGTATEEQFSYMHAQRLHKRVHSDVSPRIFPKLPKESSLPDNASASLHDEKRLAKPSQDRRS